MKRAGEVVFGVVLVSLFLIPPLIFKQYGLFSVFLAFGVIFGLLEWYSVTKTGRTISQEFWKLSKENKTAAWIIITSMFVAWMALLFHFAYKHLI